MPLYVTPKGIMPFSFDLPEAKIIKVNDIYNYYVSDQKKIAMNIKEKKLRKQTCKRIKYINNIHNCTYSNCNNFKRNNSNCSTKFVRLIYKFTRLLQ